MSTSTDLNNSPSILLPGLRNLAEKLQEAAQALIEFSQANPATNHNSENRSGSPEPATKNAVQSFEVRSYEIAHYILRDEQELLKITNSDELFDVLNKVYDHFYCIATLMKHYGQEQEACGVDLNNIAGVLALPLEWLERLSSTFNGFELVHHMKAE